MQIPHHITGHLDTENGFWIVAHIDKLDTHAKWSAQWFSSRSESDTTNSGWLFENYECDSDILREFISRGIVTKCVNGSTDESVDDNLIALNKEENEPNNLIWFELVIETFTELSVEFSFSVWAYKYHVSNISLPKQLYYLFADRLQAKVRFVHEWFALESLSRKLEAVLSNSLLLTRVTSDLKHELSLLKAPSENQIQSSCRSLFPVLERAMREYIEEQSNKHITGTLDKLIRRFESDNWVDSDTIQLMRFVMKPKRDFLQHGRNLPTPIAKIVLPTLLEVFIRLGDIN